MHRQIRKLKDAFQRNGIGNQGVFLLLLSKRINQRALQTELSRLQLDLHLSLVADYAAAPHLTVSGSELQERVGEQEITLTAP